MTQVAVIGAGLSGLVVARELAARHQVTVFEKSRGVGGRMATRYTGEYEFDHGAQFFIVRSTAFSEFLEPLIAQGAVAIWSARFAELERSRIVTTRQWDAANPHFVGAPRMNAIGKALAASLETRLNTTITRLDRLADRWQLIDAEGRAHGPFDWVITTAPAAQTAALLPAASSIRTHAEGAPMHGCCALMLAFDEPLDLPWQAALVRAADISWVSVNSSKPGRGQPFCLVVHSTNAWADAHADSDEASIRSHLLGECSEVLGADMGTAAFCGLHRWRYANTEPRHDAQCAVDTKLRLAACGDWFIHGRVEAAFSSARALLEELTPHL